MKGLDALGWFIFVVYAIGLVVSWFLWNEGGQIILTMIGLMMFSHILFLIHENTK